MNSQQIDDRLRSMLNSLPFFSRLGTCLTIRLTDYAAQLCGCRSTRQMDDSKVKEIDEQYYELLAILQDHICNAIEYISKEHSYKENIYLLDDDSFENLIEDILFEMIIYDCSFIFIERLFN